MDLVDPMFSNPGRTFLILVSLLVVIVLSLEFLSIWSDGGVDNLRDTLLFFFSVLFWSYVVVRYLSDTTGEKGRTVAMVSGLFSIFIYYLTLNHWTESS